METSGFAGQRSSSQVSVPVWAASLTLNILSLVMPISVLLIFDRIIPFQSIETLRILTIALVVCAGLELILRQSRAVLLSAAAEEAAIANHQHFLTKVLSANTAAFSKQPASTFAERHAAIGQLRDHQAGQRQVLAIDLPFTVLFAIMIGLIGGWLVLVPLSVFCAVIVFSLVMKRAQWGLFRQRKSLDTKRYSFLFEILSNIPTVKANRMEPQMARRFEMLEDQTVNISRKLIQFSGFSQSFGATIAQASVVATGLMGAYLVILTHIGVAELAACMLLNGRITQPLTKIMALWVQAESVAIANSRVDEMEKLEQLCGAGDDTRALTGEITVSNLSLKRQGEEGRSLSEVNFRVSRSETLLVKAEESWMVDAFFDAVSGQQNPDKGEILIDGLSASQRAHQKGQSALVVLETEPAIFSGTLLENLSAFGDAEMTERAKNVAAALGLEKRIHRLPMGYNTRLSSGGAFEKNPVNRQLIALTRALAIRPRILLLNEPTSVLDTPERQALADYLASMPDRPTIIMVSPDPRMMRLGSQSIRLRAENKDELAAWAADAASERAEAELLFKGVA